MGGRIASTRTPYQTEFPTRSEALWHHAQGHLLVEVPAERQRDAPSHPAITH